MWEPAKGNKAREEGNGERRKGKEGRKLTNEIKERPCGCYLRVRELLSVVH